MPTNSLKGKLAKEYLLAYPTTPTMAIARMARQSYFKVSAKAENRITVMFVIAESLKINNALPNGRSYQRMDAGTSTVKKMGDMEIIEPSGLRLTFTDNGVVPDFVPLSECCEICNDPRMINENGVLKCVVCHGINHIEYKSNDS